jgi:hypothetical protein
VVVQQCERERDARVWPDHAGHGDRDRLQRALVVARVVQVEQQLGQAHRALACGAQLHQREGVEVQQRYVLGQLPVAHVLLVVRGLHASQVQLQLVGGEQPLLEAVPVAEADIGGVAQPQLPPEALLGALCHGERELVGLEVGGAGLGDHPLVEFPVGELAV